MPQSRRPTSEESRLLVGRDTGVAQSQYRGSSRVWCNPIVHGSRIVLRTGHRQVFVVTDSWSFGTSSVSLPVGPRCGTSQWCRESHSERVVFSPWLPTVEGPVTTPESFPWYVPLHWTTLSLRGTRN